MNQESKTTITSIILTNNEELNLARCLESIRGIASQIIVVDSGSTDGTLEIAERFGARIVKRPFKNQADQFNWALDNLDIKGDWVLRLDADEYILPELAKEISETLPKTADEITGFYLRRRVYFMGRWIKHGGYYPTWILRLFRRGKARSEERAMDEHIVLSEGRAERLRNDFVDDNKKDLKSWVQKHNDFSTREVDERLNEKEKLNLNEKLAGSQAERKRWLKNNFYLKFPLFFRAFLYFIYRYFFLLGFLDGKEGLIFHFLQGCWHQFLIDAKIYEIRRAGKKFAA